jgi:hypothetical protein
MCGPLAYAVDTGCSGLVIPLMLPCGDKTWRTNNAALPAHKQFWDCSCHMRQVAADAADKGT